MKPSEIAVLPGELRLMAEAVERLPDFEPLPSLYALKFAVEYPSGSLVLRGQLWCADDFETIAQLNTWAAAIGGSLLLGDEHEDACDGSFWRQLSVLKPLSGGLLFEVWGLLHYSASADSREPIAA